MFLSPNGASLKRTISSNRVPYVHTFSNVFSAIWTSSKFDQFSTTSPYVRKLWHFIGEINSSVRMIARRQILNFAKWRSG